MARMVNTEQYAGIVSRLPPEEGGREVAVTAVRLWLRHGLIEGAYKEDQGRQEWRIPSDAKPPKENLVYRKINAGDEGYSPREWAKHLGVSNSRVYMWLQGGDVPEAERRPHGWFIPKGALDPRKRKAKLKKKALAT